MGLLVSLINFNMTTVFLFLFTIVLLFLADYLRKKLSYSYHLQGLIYVFIIDSEFLGEINHFYNETKYFDDIMHMLSSFIIAYLSLYLLKIITKDKSEKLVIIFSFMMSMAVASLWEITEFTIDNIFLTDMQKDTVIVELKSSLLSDNNKPVKKEIVSLYVNDVDYFYEYGGYIDIGLYDTMEDMICALFGALLFICMYLFKWLRYK